MRIGKINTSVQSGKQYDTDFNDEPKCAKKKKKNRITQTQIKLKRIKFEK